MNTLCSCWSTASTALNTRQKAKAISSNPRRWRRCRADWGNQEDGSLERKELVRGLSSSQQKATEREAGREPRPATCRHLSGESSVRLVSSPAQWLTRFVVSYSSGNPPLPARLLLVLDRFSFLCRFPNPIPNHAWCKAFSLPAE